MDDLTSIEFLAAPLTPGPGSSPITSGTAPTGVRLLQRAVAQGVKALEDSELLALQLAAFCVAVPADVAANLILEFGSLTEVLGATASELGRVAPPQGVFAIAVLRAAALRSARGALSGRDLLTSFDAVSTYLRAHLAGLRREQVWVLFLDKRNQLLKSEMIAEGTIDHAPVYPREIVRRAIELNSAALILAHNHPSGDPTPSRADIAMTKEVIVAAQALKIAVHDHMIVGGKTVASLRALGLI